MLVAVGLGEAAWARRVLQQLVGFEVIDLIPAAQALAEKAAVIAADYRIRGCDAVYVVLANQSNDYLVTLERSNLTEAQLWWQFKHHRSSRG